MHTDYNDIKSRISEEPAWYDSNGVPRYGEFSVKACPSIYANQVVLLRIACQVCKKEFDVEMHGDWCNPIEYPQKLHYGDPPAHNCTGDSMNCVDLEVLQVWVCDRGKSRKWERYVQYEGWTENG